MASVQTPEEKIVEVARRLFVANGYHKTHMSAIAAAASINRPTLHYYYRTKEKMFQAVFGSLVTSFLPRIQVIFCQETPFMEKIEKVVDAYIRIFNENPDLPGFIMDEARRDMPHLMHTIQSLHLESYMEDVLQVVRKEMEAGRIRTVPVSVLFVTFYSQLIYPFLSRPIILSLFYDKEEEFTQFLADWKTNFLRQMRCLLDVRE
ncbi:MAG: TetR/AcrR family transcriptional regulator [Bacteroides sp.]|nr:TetR/AcrR family transcriptional regulator [Bacteroides sp.]